MIEHKPEGELVIRFIEKSLRLDYYFNNKKTAPFISTGISTNAAIGKLTTFYNPRAFL